MTIIDDDEEEEEEEDTIHAMAAYFPRLPLVHGMADRPSSFVLLDRIQ